MKKLLAILLSCVMVLGLFACAPSTEPTQGTQATTGTQETADTTPAVEYPPEVSGSVTIEWWHTFGSGANLENLEQIVQEFNANNQWGITVNAQYIGGYADVLAKIQTDIPAGTNPVLATLNESGMGTLGLLNLLQDLTPYIQRDGTDYADFHEALTQSLLVHDVDGDGTEEILGVPYCRSVSLAYHNLDVWAEIGVTADQIPTTIEELVPLWEEVYQKTGKYGLAVIADSTFYQCGLIQSLAVKLTGQTNGGSVGVDGVSAPCLTDGTFLQVMKDWESWCQAGWCWRFTTNEAASNAENLVKTSQCATVFASSGSMGNFIRDFAADTQGTGLTADDLYATIQPGYGGSGGRCGGGNVVIIPANHTEEEIDAAWKFLQYASMDPDVTARSAVKAPPSPAWKPRPGSMPLPSSPCWTWPTGASAPPMTASCASTAPSGAVK